jgi:hypothetical protein
VSSFLEDVDRLVHHDPFQPCPEGRIATIAVKVPEGTDERLLQGIFGVFFPTGDAVADIEHGFLVKLIKPEMRITVTRFAPGDQFLMNVQQLSLQKIAEFVKMTRYVLKGCVWQGAIALLHRRSLIIS